MPNDPPSQRSGEGETPAAVLHDPKLTDTQRQILAALCRPCQGENRYATPATNQQIAGEVYLSVDAVKAHLRALYRKFGVEPLPHNQKRARLVELVLESGILASEVGDGDGRAGSAVETPPAGIPGEVESTRRWRPGRRMLIGGGVAAGLAALALLIGGAFAGDEEGTVSGQPSKAEYVEAVNGYCARTAKQLAGLGGAQLAEATTADRAVAYLTLIDAFRGRFESLPTPAGDSVALDRFRTGLQRAADLTDEVAQAPARLDAPARVRLYAELTYATGQVQSGAIGYKLGPQCEVLGELAGRSAANVSGAR